MCRAPLCKMTVLPNLPISYAVTTELSCPDFMANHSAAFGETVAVSLDPDVPATVYVVRCISSGDGRRLNDGGKKMLEVSISSDTMDAMDKISSYCQDASYTRSFTESLALLDNTVFELSSINVEEMKEPEGVPIMIMDASALDSYPASMFKDPLKVPGQALDGFAAVDAATGVIMPLVAPKPGPTKPIETNA